MDKEEYEQDLEKRQHRHLEGIIKKPSEFRPCKHDQCSRCIGTFIKQDGTYCVHLLKCNCEKCKGQK